jgi:hypothetical protein
MSRNFAQIQLHYASHAMHARSFFRSNFLSVAGREPSRIVDTVGVWGSNPHAPTNPNKLSLTRGSSVAPNALFQEPELLQSLQRLLSRRAGGAICRHNQYGFAYRRDGKLPDVTNPLLPVSLRRFRNASRRASLSRPTLPLYSY